MTEKSQQAIQKRRKATTIVYDLELFSNLFLIGFQQVDTNKIHFLQIGEGINEIQKILQLFRIPKAWFVGYNNHYFDDTIINYLFKRQNFYEGQFPNQIAGDLYKQAMKVIDGNRGYKYGVPFKAFDLMKVGSLMKSLKMVSINLKMSKIQEMPFHHQYEPQGDQELALIREYCINDVESTMALYMNLRKEINMRAATSVMYNINVMNESRSGIGNRLLEKLYSEKTGITPKYFKGQRTQRGEMLMSTIIHPDIQFTTTHMQKFLTKLRKLTVTSKSTFKEKVRLGDTIYVMGKGGLHSANPPIIVEATDDYQLIDVDAGSYYPKLMAEYKLCPAHLSKVFIDLLKEMTAHRLEAKAAGDKVTADALKLVINAVFGKTGFEDFWLYDMLTMYRVTINGQLLLLMLAESLETAGIEVFYGNTDGITARVHKDQVMRHKEICIAWEKKTRMTLEFMYFKKCIIRDVNNYLMVFTDGTEKRKGVLDIDRWKDITKSFDKPIIPIAIREFLLNDVKVEETIHNHDDLLDFCMAQKPGKAFQVVYDTIDPIINSVVRKRIQQANRYYVSNKGGSIKKVGICPDKNTGQHKEISMVAGETVIILNNYDTKVTYPEPKYTWYIKEAMKIIRLFQNQQTDMFAKTIRSS